MKKIILLLIFSRVSVSWSAYPQPQINYKTSFGNCPSRTAGALTLAMVKIFEDKKSLKSLKENIVQEKLMEKYYLSDYRVSYDPLEKLLRLNFECPRPLMKVQIYKNNGDDSYEAILVDNAQLFEPSYLTVLKEENKLKKNIPSLALPVGNFEIETRRSIAGLVNNMGEDLKKNLSELILNELNELTIILSIGERPSSVFIGPDDWELKVSKLEKIIKFLEAKKRVPSVINLTNTKKIVVKFGDKF
ncbi:MAG: cell division protein FtsQ/DivIB [Bacteriovoracales bacterium]